MVSFMLMEQSDVKIHIIHSLADDKIPFCPYFIIPYVLWYFFLIGTVIYFAVSCPSKKEYYQYLGTLGVGMTLFLLISYVYPNGQQLRPDLSNAGNGVFISVVRFLYKIDTPTNIFPSMHVFNATASCIALYQNERCRKNKIFTVSQLILGVSIVLSTMFLKQHSVADVMTALILNILCYQLFYRVIPARQKRLSEVLTRKEICTVPNLLSTLRLCLAIVFLGIFERYGVREYRGVLVLLMFAAAATDVLDGRIARSFDSVSQGYAGCDACLSGSEISTGEAYTDPVCDQRMLYDSCRMESSDGDKRDDRSTVAWQTEYSGHLCSCTASAYLARTSIFHMQCADWCMCSLHDDILLHVCSTVPRDAGASEWQLPS